MMIRCYIFFPAINKGDTKDSEMEAIMDDIVESLFSVFVTLGMSLLFKKISSCLNFLLLTITLIILKMLFSKQNALVLKLPSTCNCIQRKTI